MHVVDGVAQELRHGVVRAFRQPVADRFEYRLVLVQTIILYPCRSRPAELEGRQQRGVDDGDRADWDAALADPAPSTESARAAQPDNTAANSGGGFSLPSISLPSVSLDDAIDVINIGTSILNAAGSIFSIFGGGSAISIPQIPTGNRSSGSGSSTITGTKK